MGFRLRLAHMYFLRAKAPIAYQKELFGGSDHEPRPFRHKVLLWRAAALYAQIKTYLTEKLAGYKKVSIFI